MATGRQGCVWYQREVSIPGKKRGFHLITEEIIGKIPELSHIQMGIAHVHIKHTSASLAINENWDPQVREDMEMFLTKLIPESTPFKHSCEGPDDMPAHIKACFLGNSVNVPITDGKLNLGSWQGIWLCEHRNNAGPRKVVITLQGAPK
ncbi:hypothetical protein CHS0354_002706 [Potamilus streckersoni]|uniref:Secondary thiamine-phosphate synthase enzyme n=1 Tax=Potamilus streckersoni TaxID=2493646 RepID=A0AAE0VK54_9BIVA|nr:hypothetical protein CHS0354_002706 [Potamilus streckersoni]